MTDFHAFENLIRQTAARLSREELEEEFFDVFRPFPGIEQWHLDELERDFLEQFPTLSEKESKMVNVTQTPWSKPAEGQTKVVELSAEVFRKLSKYAAKRGHMVGKTPSQALDALFVEFRVEETS